MQSTIMTALPLVLLSIPACFGRYCEYYQKRGQLKAFIYQSIGICLCLLLLGQVVFFIFKEPLAAIAFGDKDRSWAIIGCSLAIIPFALFSFGTELLNGLRRSRATTIANFVYGLVLTVAAIALLKFFKADARSMLIAFSAGAFVALAWVGFQLFRSVRDLPKDEALLPIIASWKFLLPIVGLFWLNDFWSICSICQIDLC